MVIIGRPVNGISINGLEWLLDDNGELKEFIDSNMARSFLLENGENIENIYSYWFEDEGTRLKFSIE